MGMFDTVHVPCPGCEKGLGFQSKGGPCILRDYTLFDAPPEVLVDVAGDAETCPNCGSVAQIVAQIVAWIEIKNSSPPRVTKVFGREQNDDDY